MNKTGKILNFVNKPTNMVTSAAILDHTKELSESFREIAIDERLRWKRFTWQNLTSGDCRMLWGSLLIIEDGNLGFDSALTSSSDDDSWGIKHFDFFQDNGVLLWTSGSFWSPTIERENDSMLFAFWSGYPRYLFDHISSIWMTYHC